MHDTSFGGYDICGVRVCFSIFEHIGCGAFYVSQGEDRSFAFEVCHDDGVRIFLLQPDDFIGREAFMDVATTVPERHIASCHGVDI